MTAPGPVLLVASTGGHLAQLHRLHTRLAGVDPVSAHWATFDTQQSTSLLQGRPRHVVAFTESRDYRRVARNLRTARRILLDVQPSSVVSTGSGIALSFFPVARLMGIPLVYVESAARSDGPSLTGRAVARIPGVRTFTQYPAWADETWSYAGSVFDEYAPSREHRALSRPLRVVVSLGTIRFPFRRLVDRVLATLPADAEVLWQTGHTDVSDLGLADEPFVRADQMKRAVSEADIVISHSGVGSALDALEAGKHPVLVHRETAHGEHVDDHQELIGIELQKRGLATSCAVDDLTPERLLAAASRGAVRVSDVPLFDIGLPAAARASERSAPSLSASQHLV